MDVGCVRIVIGFAELEEEGCEFSRWCFGVVVGLGETRTLRCLMETGEYIDSYNTSTSYKRNMIQVRIPSAGILRLLTAVMKIQRFYEYTNTHTYDDYVCIHFWE